jgi:hypothetical protein
MSILSSLAALQKLLSKETRLPIQVNSTVKLLVADLDLGIFPSRQTVTPVTRLLTRHYNHKSKIVN